MKKYSGTKKICLWLLMSMLFMTAFLRVQVHAEPAAAGGISEWMEGAVNSNETIQGGTVSETSRQGKTETVSETSRQEKEDVEKEDAEESSLTPEEEKEIEQTFRFRHFVFWAAGGLIVILIAFVLSSGARKRRHLFQEYTPTEDETEALSSLAENNVILTDSVRADERYILPKGQTVTLGRSRARCDLAFPAHRSMSSRQARIFFADGKVFLENLDTMETTCLNGKVVRGVEELPNGSLIQLGDKQMKVRYDENH